MVIPRHSKHRTLASEWIRPGLSQAVQEGIAVSTYCGPTSSRVKLSGDVANKLVYGAGGEQRLVTPDWQWIVQQLPDWNE